nr:unnamed protein product [Callosobruchus analis]CAI5859894.1 unnamed protein product [Callosobruchus analis]
MCSFLIFHLTVFYIGDDAFPSRTNLLKPYLKSAPLSLGKSKQQNRLSKQHVLYTIAKTSGRTCFPTGCVDTESVENSIIIPGEWRKYKSHGLASLGNVGGNRYARNTAQKRDLYAEKFLTTDLVPWQWRMI